MAEKLDCYAADIQILRKINLRGDFITFDQATSHCSLAWTQPYVVGWWGECFKGAYSSEYISIPTRTVATS